MICQQGRVLSVGQRDAVIVVDPQQACSACARGQGCGMSIFSRWLGSRAIRFKVRSGPGWHPGQSVSLQVAPPLLLRLAAWAYGLPLVGFITAAGLATRLVGTGLGTAGSDLIALLCGVAGMLAGALAVRRWSAPLVLSRGPGQYIRIE